jgi:soluble lytic murein transglycosylase-like protein
MTRTWRRIVVAALSICSAALEARADTVRPCEREMARAAQLHGIPLGILYAVGLTETGRRGALHPYALGAEGQTIFAGNVDDALASFESMRQKGTKLIDLGCMQINQHYHGDHFRSVDDMLDPHQNVDYAARFLADLHARHMTWSMAVARYHAGPDNDPAQKVYVCRVIANMVATGFGKWTPNASAFCNQ